MPSKAKDTVVETQAPETAACSCGTHGSFKIIVHVVIGFVALFMLASAFAAGAFIGKFAGNHDGRNGMYGSNGTCTYIQDAGDRGRTGNRGPGMMNRDSGYGRGMMDGDSGYGRGMMDGGRGMMNGGQGYYYDQQDSTAPGTQEVPAR